MSHGSRVVWSLSPLLFSVCFSRAPNVGERRLSTQGSVPCTEWWEQLGQASSPRPRASQLSVWLRPRCCRPPHPTVGSFHFPQKTPSPLWSRQPCSRSSPRCQQVRPWCRPVGSEPWCWGPGPHLWVAWCFPPAGDAARCCEVARKKCRGQIGLIQEFFSVQTFWKLHKVCSVHIRRKKNTL